jgi:glucokinase
MTPLAAIPGPSPLILGIEIGGTKLQFAIGTRAGERFAAFRRLAVEPSRGAEGILTQIREYGGELLKQTPVSAIGVGFGGPVRTGEGRVGLSHQISGWHEFPLRDWLQDTFGLPAFVINDCDAAGLAEATAGAGRDEASVFYVTVGSGIGGGLVLNRRSFGLMRPAVSEIGHLRFPVGSPPKLVTVESMASGWGIAERARQILDRKSSPSAHATLDPPGEFVGDGLERSQLSEHWQPLLHGDLGDLFQSSLILKKCEGRPDTLTTVMIGAAAAEGDPLACWLLDTAWQVLGCGISDMICLLAPEVVVIGGGMSLLSHDLFWDPLRFYVDQMSFVPLRNSYRIAPAALGENVVVYGALEFAFQQRSSTHGRTS